MMDSPRRGEVKRGKDGLTDGERGRKEKGSGRYEKQSRHQEEDGEESHKGKGRNWLEAE